MPGGGPLQKGDTLRCRASAHPPGAGPQSYELRRSYGGSLREAASKVDGVAGHPDEPGSPRWPVSWKQTHPPSHAFAWGRQTTAAPQHGAYRHQGRGAAAADATATRPSGARGHLPGGLGREAAVVVPADAVGKPIWVTACGYRGWDALQVEDCSSKDTEQVALRRCPAVQVADR